MCNTDFYKKWLVWVNKKWPGILLVLWVMSAAVVASGKTQFKYVLIECVFGCNDALPKTAKR